jgi:hypothetical protein
MVALRCYLANGEGDVIRVWIASQPGPIRGAVNAVLEGLQAIPSKRWRRKRFARLGAKQQRECSGLGEIRVEADGEHYRILGYFSDEGEETFTMLLAFKKDCDPAYHNACPLAQTRKADVENDPSKSVVCRFPSH